MDLFQPGPPDGLRLHETLLLRSTQLQQYAPSGTIAGVVGVVVGYGSNFINVLEDDDNGRMVLNNGYHPACALLELGISHAPCIVQTVSRRDELDIAARPVVARDPGYFFNGARPPPLRDFADPRIATLVPVGRLTETIDVSVEVREFYSREHSRGQPAARPSSGQCARWRPVTREPGGAAVSAPGAGRAPEPVAGHRHAQAARLAPLVGAVCARGPAGPAVFCQLRQKGPCTRLSGARAGDGAGVRLVHLRRQSVTAYGRHTPLQAGMQLEADIVLERRRLIDWVLDPLYSFTGKLAG